MKSTKKIVLLAALVLAVAMLVGLTVFASPVSAQELDGWQMDANGEWYYYNDGSMLADEWEIIDGNYFYFDENGVMANDEWIPFPVSDGTEWMYAKPGGYLCYNETYAVNGVLYGFHGIWMGVDEFSISIYDEEADEWEYKYFFARANGSLYVNEWYFDEEWDEWYWYGADGAAASGYQVIGGTPYLFYDWGVMVEGDGGWMITDADDFGGLYYIDILDHAHAIAPNGWTKIGTRWVYAENNELYRQGIYSIGGTYYAFNYEGFMAANGADGMWTQDDDYISYYAFSNGRLATNEWVQREGGWYYYGENACRLEDGLYCIGGNWYMFEYGWMVTNAEFEYDGYYYLFNSNGTSRWQNEGWLLDFAGRWLYIEDGFPIYSGIYVIDGVLYGFDNGRLINEVCSHDDYFVKADGVVDQTPGWKRADGYYYFVAEDGMLIRNDWLDEYYFDWDGRMEASSIWIDYSTGDLMVSSTSGVTKKVTTDGWYVCDSGYVLYVEDGDTVKDEWRQIGGYWYYFDCDGWALDGTCWVGEDRYYFDADYRMLAGGWARIDEDEWVYAAEDGRLYTDGIYEIDGVEYEFNQFGTLYTNYSYTELVWNEELEEYEGRWVKCDKNGAVTETALNLGWNLLDGNWYYLNEYGEFESGVCEIGDETYFFDWYTHIMQANVIYGNYYFAENGAAIFGWRLLPMGWIWANEYAQLAEYGVYEIDGEEYLFVDGYLAVSRTVELEGYVIVSDASGRVVSNEMFARNGWLYLSFYGQGIAGYIEDGTPYTGWMGEKYFDNGAMCQDRVVQIDGKLYYFDLQGNLVRNRWIEYKYGYSYYDTVSDWYYAKADGSLCMDEWLNLGGTWYYFSGIWMMRDSVATIDGVDHNFAENGAWLGEYRDNTVSGAYADGWNRINGEWYFFMAGQAVYGEVYDGANWYYMQPQMVTNAFAMAQNSMVFYYDASGARANYTGWKMIEGRWVYFNQNSQVRLGWNNINGTTYYIDFEFHDDGTLDVGMVSGKCLLGYYYGDYTIGIFDASGVYLGPAEDGWHLIGSDWYYVINGSVCCEDYIFIDGVEYGFDYEGKMIANGAMFGCYFGANGARVYNSWVNTEDGWLYILPNGRIASGVHMIDGTLYYFRNYEGVA